jgi:hypothetical protein
MLLGTAAMTVPLAREWGTPRGPSPVFPTRLVIFYTPNGTVADAWRPTGTETSFTLGPIMAPLAPFQDRLLILDEVNNYVARGGAGGGHARGMGTLLTGVQLPPGPFLGAAYAASISIDQLIAQSVGAATLFRSLELAVQPRGSEVWERLSYAGPNEPMPPFESPWDAASTLFGEIAASNRQAYLDLLATSRDELKEVTQLYAGDDARRLAFHGASLDEVERRLRLTPPAITVPPPSLGAPLDLEPRENFGPIGRKHIDVLVAALANDRTRVATLQWAKASGDPTFPDLGFPEPHHELSHRPDDDADGQDKLTRINRWYAGHLAYLLGQLASIREGDETLLDHTCVVWTSELGKGNIHSYDNTPFVLCGGANGQLKTGRYLKLGGASHLDLLVSLANLMGVPRTTFGDTRYCHGPLAGLT